MPGRHPDLYLALMVLGNSFCFIEAGQTLTVPLHEVHQVVTTGSHIWSVAPNTVQGVGTAVFCPEVTQMSNSQPAFLSASQKAQVSVTPAAEVLLQVPGTLAPPAGGSWWAQDAALTGHGDSRVPPLPGSQCTPLPQLCTPCLLASF